VSCGYLRVVSWPPEGSESGTGNVTAARRSKQAGAARTIPRPNLKKPKMGYPTAQANAYATKPRVGLKLGMGIRDVDAELVAEHVEAAVNTNDACAEHVGEYPSDGSKGGSYKVHSTNLSLSGRCFSRMFCCGKLYKRWGGRTIRQIL
jgi:hypothetical protein